MDSFWILLFGALILWLFAKDRRRARKNQEMEERLEQFGGLEDRIRVLEAEIKQHPQPAPSPATRAEAAVTQNPEIFIAPKKRAAAEEAPMPATVLPPVEVEVPRAEPEAPPTPSIFNISPEEIAAPERHASLEEKLGANWLNKLGIIILVIGVAFFLAYQLRTLGPLGKTVTGLAVAATLLVGGLILERRDSYRIFARAGIGGGWALTFFVAYAMYHVPATQVITSQAADLVLMLLIAVGMVWHSLRYKSQVVTALAFLLAFTTLYISHVDVFSLIASAILAAGLVVVVHRHRWYELEIAGLIAVYLNHYLWLDRVMDAAGGPHHSFPQFFASAGLLIFYWFIFRIAYIIRRPIDRRGDLLSATTAILNSAALLGLLKYQSTHPEWAFYGLIVLGTVEMVFALFTRSGNRTAFIILSSIASIFLIAAIPFRFSGSNWSLLWLLEAEVLFLSGIRMREVVFRRLGIAAGYIAALQLFIDQLLPLFTLRQEQPDSTRHFAFGMTLACAAILYWLNGELAPRRCSELFAEELDRYGMQAMSGLGLAAAAAASWVFFPASQTVVAWMILVVALSWIADRLSSGDLTFQADALAAAAFVRVLVINIFITDRWGSLPQRTVTLALAASLYYLCTRRKARTEFISIAYIAPAYSSAGTTLLALLLWYQLRPVSVAVGWAMLGLVLFELGILRRRDHLRWQGYILLAASFIRIFFVNLSASGTSHLTSPRVYTVLPLVAAYFWTYERMQSLEATPGQVERIVSYAASFLGTAALAALLYFELAPDWVVVSWAVLVFALALAALILRRRIFVAQALLLAVGVFARAALFNLFESPLVAGGFWTTRLITVGSAAIILFVALPIAFRLRRIEHPSMENSKLSMILSHPEQLLFFIPFSLLIILLAVELRSGIITIAWSAFGVLTFLLALWVGERSYRLAGLGLLLLGVGKILCIDIWNLGPSDRYLTLIIMGAALLLVSFLYTRYRETVLKFL